MTPAAYNGTYIAASGTTGSTLVVPLASNPGTATAFGGVNSAAFVQMGDATGDNPDSQSLDHVHAEGFNVQVDVQSGQYWHISNFDLHNALMYGIRVRDVYNANSGDGTFPTGTIYADGTVGKSAIRYQSGGGLKVMATKVL